MHPEMISPFVSAVMPPTHPIPVTFPVLVHPVMVPPFSPEIPPAYPSLASLSPSDSMVAELVQLMMIPSSPLRPVIPAIGDLYASVAGMLAWLWQSMMVP